MEEAFTRSRSLLDDTHIDHCIHAGLSFPYDCCRKCRRTVRAQKSVCPSRGHGNCARALTGTFFFSPLFFFALQRFRAAQIGLF